MGNFPFGKRNSKSFAAWFFVILFFLSGCSRNVVVKPTDYSSLNKEKVQIQITTKSGNVFRTSHYFVEGDSLIVDDPGALLQNPTKAKLPLS